MNNNLADALNYIINNDEEIVAINVLVEAFNNKYTTLIEQFRLAKSSLKAINKINASNNRDKQNSIDILSNIEEL